MVLTISSLGMITSVGHDVKTACASIRAGLSRPAQTEINVVDDEEMETAGLLGHPVAMITDGFQGVGRLARLAEKALSDLIAYGNLTEQPEDFWQQTGLAICATPVNDADLSFFDEMIVDELPVILLNRLGLPISFQNCRIFLEANASAVHACAWANKAMEAGELRRCIVLGADSLINETDVNHYRESGRLKELDTSTGLIPGEAAAAILLEDVAVASSRNAKVTANIDRIALGREQDNFLAEKPAYGRAFAHCLLKVIPTETKISEIYVDLNGETGRALDWGHAIPLVTESLGYFPEQINIPAINIGDTRAASGLIAICLAVRSIDRNYLAGNDVVICSISDSGSLGCIQLSRAN